MRASYTLHYKLKMSVSLVGSTASCWVNGKEIPLEIQLEEIVSRMQNHLNRAQLHLREIACACEQDCTQVEELDMSGHFYDEILEMQFLLEDFRTVSLDLISEPQNAVERAVLKEFLQARKSHEKKRIAEHKAQMAAEKLANKTAKMESVAEGKKGMQD